MHVLCVSIPHYALALARREASDIAPEIPAVLADKPDRGRVLAADDRARASGARAGQTVLQARAVATRPARCRAEDDGPAALARHQDARRSRALAARSVRTAFRRTSRTLACLRARQRRQSDRPACARVTDRRVTLRRRYRNARRA